MRNNQWYSKRWTLIKSEIIKISFQLLLKNLHLKLLVCVQWDFISNLWCMTAGCFTVLLVELLFKHFILESVNESVMEKNKLSCMRVVNRGYLRIFIDRILTSPAASTLHFFVLFCFVFCGTFPVWSSVFVSESSWWTQRINQQLKA